MPRLTQGFQDVDIELLEEPETKELRGLGVQDWFLQQVPQRWNPALNLDFCERAWGKSGGRSQTNAVNQTTHRIAMTFASFAPLSGTSERQTSLH